MRALVLVLAAFAAGLGLGLFLQDGDPPARVERAAGQGNVEPGDILLPSTARPRVEDPGAPAVEPIAGTGRIGGRVTDEGGNPVAGVRIVAEAARVYRPKKSRRGSGGPPAPDLDRDVKEFVSNWRKRQAGRREAISGEDGRYELTGLQPRAHSIHGYLEGSEVRARRSAHRVEPGAAVDFVASRLVRVELFVTLSNQTMPDAVSLSVERTKKDGTTVATADAWTPSQQWVDLPVGRYKLSASLPGDHQSRSNTARFEVVAGQRVEPVELKIMIRPRVRVRVEPPEGFGRARTRAWIMRITGERVPDAAELFSAGHANYGSMEDEQTWLFANLGEGRYLIGGSLMNAQAVAVTEVVEVNAPLIERTLRLPTPDPRTHHRVRLLAPDGSALRRAAWSNCFRSKSRRSSRGTGAQCDERGVHYIALEPEHAGLSGEHFLRATHEDYGQLEFMVDPKAPALSEARFQVPATLVVTVTGQRGTPLEGRLILQLGSEGYARGEALDGDGRSRLGPVQPGEFELVLRRRVGRHGSYELLRRTIELASGEKLLAVPVPKLHALSVRWTGEGRPRIRLRSRGGRFDYEVPVAENGTASFDYLPPGAYRLHAQGVSSRRTVAIPETTEISLP